MATVKREQILQEAEKLAGRGKFDAAIREYQRALNQAPNDTNTLNKLGDLLVRVNRVDEAAGVYQRIAEHFANDGFFLKAIAIYKKINRLDPQQTEVYERLADLYFKQGLAVEGRQQLLTLADWFLRAKNAREAIRLYRRLTQLEPGNFQVRGRLIDLLVQEGRKDLVADEIRQLGSTLVARGLLDDAAKLADRALEVGPPATVGVVPVIEGLLAAGRAVEGGSLAERALAQDEESFELRRVAARAFAEAKDVGRARTILDGLMPEVGEHTEILEIYGDVMLKANEPDLAKSSVLPLIDRLTAAGSRERASNLMRRLLRAHPGDVEVLEHGLKVIDRRTEGELAQMVRASLADAYFRAGRGQDARGLYRELHRQEPDNELFATRLRALGDELVESSRVAKPAAPVASAALGPDGAGASGAMPATASPVTPAEQLQSSVEGDPGVEFHDIDLSFDGMFEAPPDVVSPADVAGAESMTVSMPPAPEAAPQPLPPQDTNAEELYTEAVVFAKYGLGEKAVSHLHRLLSLDPGHARGRKLLAELGGGELVEVELDASPQVEEVAAPAASGEPAPDEEPAPVAAPVAAPVGAPVAAPVGGHVAARPESHFDDLESVLGLDFKVPARPTPRAPESGAVLFEAPAPPQVPVLSETPEPGPLAAVRFAPEPEEVIASSPAEHQAPPDTPPGRPNPVEDRNEAIELVELSLLAGPGDDDLGELDFLIHQGMREEAVRVLQHLESRFGENDELLARHALLKAQGWDETPLPGGEPAAERASELFRDEESFFDLAAELERELADEELVAEATGAGKGQPETSIEELFKEFQRGVAEQLGDEDFDTHFNLGLAYREMGLVDEAIGEFQLSARADYLFVESASMLGACFLEKGLAEEAAGWYERALKAPEIAPEAELGLRYELARALEDCGNLAAALARYAEVLAMNPAFRDVQDRVSRLRSN